jgi:tetratricopeptide (TPR) repeat protein
LRQVERSCELSPSSHHVHTLGAAYYRVGEFAKAIDTIKKAISLRPEKKRKEGFWDLPFLAMSHHHLGKIDQARADLKNLRALAKEERYASDEALFRALLAEAEEVVEGKR